MNLFITLSTVNTPTQGPHGSGGPAAAAELRPFGALDGRVIHVRTHGGEERSW